MASQQQASVAAILRSHPPQKWDTSDVKRWLESIGMDVYSPIFEATGVQGSDLIQMDAEALKRRCGVSSLGHRTQIMSQIAILSARATMSIKREGEKSAVSKRKEVGRPARRTPETNPIATFFLLGVAACSKSVPIMSHHSSQTAPGSPVLNQEPLFPPHSSRLATPQLLENLYPDKARRNIKAAMDEKLLEAREMYWTPDDRKVLSHPMGPSSHLALLTNPPKFSQTKGAFPGEQERGANEQNKAEKMRGRPTSAQRQRPGNDMFVTEGMAPVESRREAAGIHRPPVNTVPTPSPDTNLECDAGTGVNGTILKGLARRFRPGAGWRRRRLAGLRRPGRVEGASGRAKSLWSWMGMRRSSCRPRSTWLASLSES